MAHKCHPFRVASCIRRKYSELQVVSEENIQATDLKCLSLAIFRERRKEFPKLPKSRADVHIAIDMMDIKSKDEPFRLHNDHEAGIVIFSCTRNLQCLCNEASAIFIDGIFTCSHSSSSKCTISTAFATELLSSGFYVATRKI